MCSRPSPRPSPREGRGEGDAGGTRDDNRAIVRESQLGNEAVLDLSGMGVSIPSPRTYGERVRVRGGNEAT